MRNAHMNPAESVQAFIDCGAELALGHHYGTFQLTDEAIDAPLVALAEALHSQEFRPSASARCGPDRSGSCDALVIASEAIQPSARMIASLRSSQ